MREREEYIKDIWIEIILRSAKMLDADFTMPHDIARERAFTEVIGRVLDKRESLAAATRVTDEMVERVVEAAFYEGQATKYINYSGALCTEYTWEHSNARRLLLVSPTALDVPRDE
jgi:hypothetical protein